MANKSVVDEVASSSADTIDRTRLRRSFWFVSFAFFVTMLGTTTPTPLYVLYQSRFHFSDGMITGVYAVYPLAVMLVLLGFGRLSDQIGRRKVLLTALGCAILSSIVFVFAQNLGWLFVGRFISGVSAGLVMGTATAALNELQPQRNTRFAALISTASNMLGLGVGPLLSGVLAQYTPWSTVTPYLAHIGLVILALLGLATIPETVRKQAAQASRRPQRVGIPNGIRFIFIVSAAAVFCAYSLLSLFTSLAPTLVDSLIGIHVASCSASSPCSTMSPSLKRISCKATLHFGFWRTKNSRSMPKCLNSSPWALAMMARAWAFGSTARRCSYQPMASASSVSEAIIRAKVRVSCGSSFAGSWYWSNPMGVFLSSCC